MRLSRKRFLGPLLLAGLLAGCATAPQPRTSEITIFGLNDFHGQIQSAHPVPVMRSEHDPAEPGEAATVATGGYAYLSTLLKERRQQAGPNILVGAGDLIGASPAGSAMLKDEPAIEALNRLGMDVSAVGNHEFDGGQQELLRKIAGTCPAQGCKFPGFHGARYTYLAANVIDKASGKPWLTPYVIRSIGGVDVAFIGAVTADTPNIVMADNVRNLEFLDEAEAINRYVPEVKKLGVAAIVVLIHEGGEYKGAANDPSYRCEGLQGPIVNIAHKLDPAVDVVMSGHTHKAYTCKLDGRLVVSGHHYGALLTEVKLKIDPLAKRVVTADAHNWAVEQRKLQADPEAQQLVEQAEVLTAHERERLVTTLAAPLTTDQRDGWSDSTLGNVVADAQLVWAQQSGQADVAFMNDGGIRHDLNDVQVKYGDLFVVQPFGNGVLKMQLSGAQILALLEHQWNGGRAPDNPKLLYVSHGFSYAWSAKAPEGQRIRDARLNGQPLSPEHLYTVVVNSFMADGGDGFALLKEARQRRPLGTDVDVLESYLKAMGPQLSAVDLQRIKRID